MNTRPAKTLRPLSAALIASGAMLLAVPAHSASLAISQVPLYLGGTVEPNIMFVLDDSGSMAWSFMPDSIYGYYNTKRAKSSTFNQMYYDPAFTYLPPLDQDGVSRGDATFTNAWHDGYSTSRGTNTTNLSQYFRPTWYYAGTSTQYSDNTQQAAFYYVFNTGNANCNGTTTDDDCYTYVRVSSTSGPGNTDERTNFANWYSYYRNRMYAAKAGVSRAFGPQGTGMRVGYGRINKGSATIDGVSTTTLERGVRDFSDTDIFGNTTNNRSQFFDWLFATQPTGNTPLRRALDAAGSYYERSDDKGPASTTPNNSGGNDLSCRQNFTILTTDGYWNSSSASNSNARQNNDGSNGPLITGPNSKSYQYTPVAPYSDSWSDGLADIAMYYWNRDLRTDLTNNVPTNSDDPAFWQHMVTFGVGLGVTGSITPATAYANIGTQTDPGWPNPSASDPAKIDDLLHASINGHGEFFSAKDPQAFSNALTATLASINARSSSAATVASNSTRLSTNTLLFQATFDSDGWTGDMLAYKIDTNKSSPTYGLPMSTTTWKASSGIPTYSQRNVFTINPSTMTGLPFKWASLSTTQQSALNNTSSLLDWVLGDQSKEVSKTGGIYRTRKQVMGDVINSDPAFVKSEDYGYSLSGSLSSSERSAYVSRRTSTSFINRKGALFFGGNDGIFRGLDSDTGKELFGYVPNSILSGLPSLAATNYTHKYYVDGSPVVTDALLGGNWKTVLVSSTGAGGKAFFALNVETAHTFSASDVLWEVSDTTLVTGSYPFAELGYTLGQAAVGRTESGDWVAIFGNGYNSTSQKAQLFVVNLSTGALIKKIDTGAGSTSNINGLATPTAIDADLNGSIDLVYAGDLLGNVWKFDFTGTSSSSWKVAFGGKPLFQAKDNGSPAQVQPITAQLQVSAHPKKGLMVYFGTGKYFETGDNSNTAQQSLYGVQDECGQSVSGSGCASVSSASKVARSELLVQKITYEGTQSFNGNTWDIRLFSQNTLTNEKGFLVDLVPPSNIKEGERVLSAPILWRDRVIYVSSIPDDDACAGGGSSWIIELAPYTGARTDFSVFDLARDGSYGDTSKYDNGNGKESVNGRKVVGGMIKSLGQVRDGGLTHKYGSTSTGSIDTSSQQSDGGRRISWRQVQ